MKTKMISTLHHAGVIIPEGEYAGRMSGYEVEFLHSASLYWFRTESGVRGLNVPVTITVAYVDGNMEIQVTAN